MAVDPATSNYRRAYSLPRPTASTAAPEAESPFRVEERARVIAQLRRTCGGAKRSSVPPLAPAAAEQRAGTVHAPRAAASDESVLRTRKVAEILARQQQRAVSSADAARPTTTVVRHVSLGDIVGGKGFNDAPATAPPLPALQAAQSLPRSRSTSAPRAAPQPPSSLAPAAGQMGPRRSTWPPFQRCGVLLARPTLPHRGR